MSVSAEGRAGASKLTRGSQTTGAGVQTRRMPSLTRSPCRQWAVRAARDVNVEAHGFARREERSQHDANRPKLEAEAAGSTQQGHSARNKAEQASAVQGCGAREEGPAQDWRRRERAAAGSPRLSPPAPESKMPVRASTRAAAKCTRLTCPPSRPVLVPSSPRPDPSSTRPMNPHCRSPKPLPTCLRATASSSAPSSSVRPL